jgi:DNA-binding transcriptional LysR family regulator
MQGDRMQGPARADQPSAKDSRRERSAPSVRSPSPSSRIRLLRSYTLPPVEVHAVFPGGPRPSAKMRALVDYLAEELRKSDGRATS